MLKYLVASAVVAVLGCGSVTAAELKGKVKSADMDKATVTLTVGDKEQTLTVAKDAEVYSLGKAKKGKPAPKVAVVGGLGSLKEGTEVTVTTEAKNGKDVATAIHVEGVAKKKKKNK